MGFKMFVDLEKTTNLEKLKDFDNNFQFFKESSWQKLEMRKKVKGK